MAKEDTKVAPARQETRLARRTPMGMGSPFGSFRRLAEEMDRMFDRMFDEFGFGRALPASRFGRRDWLTAPLWRGAEEGFDVWSPDVEVIQRGNELVVRADLPGLKKDDIKIDVTDDAIIIQGERRHEQEQERKGYYRSERSYGSFYRAIPLPEGAITDQAKAKFHDGVLEVTVPAPPEQVTRGRHLEITEGAEQKK